MFAASATEFFLKLSDVRFSFVVDAQERVTGQLMRRGSREVLVGGARLTFVWEKD